MTKAELLVKYQELDDYLTVSRRWALSHEEGICARWHNDDVACTCGLDEFLSNPRKFLAKERRKKNGVI